MELKFEMEDSGNDQEVTAKIKIVGVGGCGCNIVSDMYSIGVEDAELIGINTDKQSLERISADDKVQLGRKGTGAGEQPEMAERAAEEERAVLESKLTGTDLLFIAAGLGGGTGSGAGPVVAEIARALDILTVGVVITPFDIELDDRKKKRVDEAMARMKEKVNNLVVIANDRIYDVCDAKTPVFEAYKEVNKSMINIINGIVTMIAKTGMQNIDFEDVKTTLKQPGSTFMGIGRANGTDRAKKAFEAAIKNPFMGGIDLSGAKNILVNFVGNITMADMNEIKAIKEKTGSNTGVKIGILQDINMADEIEVVLLISGLKGQKTPPAKEANCAPVEQNHKRVAVEALVRQVAESDYDNDILDQPAFLRLGFDRETRQ